MCERIDMHPADITEAQSASVRADLLGRAHPAASRHTSPTKGRAVDRTSSNLDERHVTALRREANRRASGHFVPDLTSHLVSVRVRVRVRVRLRLRLRLRLKVKVRVRVS